MKKRINERKKGSATLVIIISAIVFLIYATSTFADVRQMKQLHKEYVDEMVKHYENNYTTIVERLI